MSERAAETHDAVDVIRTKRDGGELSDAQIDWVVDAYTRGVRGRRADVGAGDGDPAQRHGPARDLPLDRRDDRLRRADGLLVAVAAHRRQALDRRGGRQDHPAAGTPGGRVRGRGAAAVRPRPGPHRRHARQARVGAGVAGRALQRRDDAAARGRRRRHLRGRRRPRSGRQEAVRAPRRHGHGRGDPADRVVDHEQEDRRGHGRAGARRQGRLGRVHEEPRRRPRAGPDDGRPRHRRRRHHGRAADEHGRPARSHRRQRARGARVGRGARRRWPAGRRRAHPGAGARDARAPQASTTSTRPTGSPTGPRWTRGRR